MNAIINILGKDSYLGYKTKHGFFINQIIVFKFVFSFVNFLARPWDLRIELSNSIKQIQGEQYISNLTFF